MMHACVQGTGHARAQAADEWQSQHPGAGSPALQLMGVGTPMARLEWQDHIYPSQSIQKG
jgi:hypothetical protein